MRTIILGNHLNVPIPQSNKNIWKKDGASKIPKAKLGEKEGENTITILDVKAGDSGKYFCEAHNRAGSRSAHVTVNIVAGKATPLRAGHPASQPSVPLSFLPSSIPSFLPSSLPPFSPSLPPSFLPFFFM